MAKHMRHVVNEEGLSKMILFIRMRTLQRRINSRFLEYSSYCKCVHPSSCLASFEGPKVHKAPNSPYVSSML